MQELWRDIATARRKIFSGGFLGRFLPAQRRQHPGDVLSWQHDISVNLVFNGDFKKALGAIKAKAVVMPGEMDLYSRRGQRSRVVAQMNASAS
jgi:homoserine O-acetyltransferase